ncbi:hypothetical protein ASE41_16885 [Streptomyces sp. Root264]|nr:hypothetical protein ASE41_16885 [Streptomyces sp. Root264]
MAADNRSPEVKSPAAAARVPNRATPTALPTCRATLKTAQAMPAPEAGAVSMMAAVAARAVMVCPRPVAIRANSRTG